MTEVEQVEPGVILGPTRFEICPQGIGNLFAALAKARKSFKPVLKSSQNPFFKSKYADLAEVIDATKDGLSDNELAIVQPPCFRRSDGTVEIYTFMGHSSGEWIKSILDMPVTKLDPQGVGSAITYGRRYSYSGMVSVASEVDDDGNSASGKKAKDAPPEETEEEFDQRTDSQKNLYPSQIQEIDKAIKATGKTEEEVLAYLGLLGEKRIEHLKRNQYVAFLKWASTPSKGPKAVPDERREKAMKRLFAVANEHNVPEEDVKRFSYEKFNVDSMTKLTIDQLAETAKWIKDVNASLTGTV